MLDSIKGRYAFYLIPYMAILLVPASAYLTHIVRCFQREEFLTLIIGAILFPIGVLHGWGIWLGFF